MIANSFQFYVAVLSSEYRNLFLPWVDRPEVIISAWLVVSSFLARHFRLRHWCIIRSKTSHPTASCRARLEMSRSRIYKNIMSIVEVDIELLCCHLATESHFDDLNVYSTNLWSTRSVVPSNAASTRG